MNLLPYIWGGCRTEMELLLSDTINKEKILQSPVSSFVLDSY